MSTSRTSAPFCWTRAAMSSRALSLSEINAVFGSATTDLTNSSSLPKCQDAIAAWLSRQYAHAFSDDTYAAMISRSPAVNELGACRRMFARSAIGLAASGRNAKSARMPAAPSGRGIWATRRLYWPDPGPAIVGNYYSRLVLGRHLRAVDDDDLDLASLGVELESQVFTQRGQERRAVGRRQGHACREVDA